MKSNITLSVNFGNHTLPVETKTELIKLNDLVEIGNKYRIENGKKPMRMDKIISSTWFKEYSEVIQEELSNPEKGVVKNDDFNSPKKGELKKSNVTISLPVIKTRSGKYNSGTWVNYKIGIRVAIQMNARFANEVIDKFIKGELIERRMIAGDLTNEINKRIYKLQDTENKAKEYQDIAKAFAYIVTDAYSKDWRQFATPDELKELSKLQEKYIMLIDEGYIKTHEELIEKLRGEYKKKYKLPF